MSSPTEIKFMPDFKPGLLVMSVHVAKPDVPSHIIAEAESNNMIPKDISKVHISVVVTANARKLHKAVAKHKNPEDIKRAVKDLFESFTWEYSLTDEYFIQERVYDEQHLIDSGYEDLTPHIRRSIVQKVDLPDLVIFYNKLNKKLGISLTIPVPHITLFSWSDYEPNKPTGIGISSKEEFESNIIKVL